MKMELSQITVLIRGGGELASGVAHRLHQCHLKVCITEIAKPLAVRREVAFSEAVYQGSPLTPTGVVVSARGRVLFFSSQLSAIQIQACQGY